MKFKYLIAAVLLASSLGAAAQDATISAEPGTRNNTETDINGSLNSNNGNYSEDNSATSVVGDTYSGQYVSHNDTRVEASAPPVSAPIITTGYDTCGVAVSGGLSGPGVGLSFGKNKADQVCERLKLSKMLQSLGLKDAAVALMLQDERVLEAMKVSNPKLAETLGPKPKKRK